MLVAGGEDEAMNNIISLHSPNDDFKVLAKFTSTSRPLSVCCTSFGDGRRILVGSKDGFVRMIDAGVHVAPDDAEPYEGGSHSVATNLRQVSDAPGLGKVSAVAIISTAGLVVAGHEDVQFSLWRAESGNCIDSFEDERGDWVSFVTIAADEGLAMSGHKNGIALVWNISNASTPLGWECVFALRGHSKRVVCGAISVDAKQIVTVDWDREVRVWKADIGGGALSIIGTGLAFSVVESRGAISLCGEKFLWASRDEHHKNWRLKVIGLRSASVIWQSTEAENTDWVAFLDDLMPSAALDSDKKVRWRFCALYRKMSMELPDADSGLMVVDGWRISTRGEYFPHIDFALGSADGGTVPAAASLGFDSHVTSIDAGWIRREANSRRCAVVACRLDGWSYPAVMHFFPAIE